MFILIILLIVFLFIIIYKTSIINELEIRNNRLRKLQIAEILDLLYQIQDTQNFEDSASRDTQIRRIVTENIEKYEEQKRTIYKSQINR